MFARIINSFDWRAQGFRTRPIDLPNGQHGRETTKIDPPGIRGMEVSEKLIVLDYHSAMN
jgi:hypothetical protein